MRPLPQRTRRKTGVFQVALSLAGTSLRESCHVSSLRRWAGHRRSNRRLSSRQQWSPGRRQWSPRQSAVWPLLWGMIQEETWGCNHSRSWLLSPRLPLPLRPRRLLFWRRFRGSVRMDLTQAHASLPYRSNHGGTTEQRVHAFVCNHHDATRSASASFDGTLVQAGLKSSQCRVGRVPDVIVISWRQAAPLFLF